MESLEVIPGVQDPATRMLGNDEEWEEHCDTLLQDLVGRDLISVKEDYRKHDENPQFESQIESQLKPKDCRLTWEKDEHGDDSNAKDWEDHPERAWFLPG